MVNLVERQRSSVQAWESVHRSRPLHKIVNWTIFIKAYLCATVAIQLKFLDVQSWESSIPKGGQECTASSVVCLLKVHILPFECSSPFLSLFISAVGHFSVHVAQEKAVQFLLQVQSNCELVMLSRSLLPWQFGPLSGLINAASWFLFFSSLKLLLCLFHPD